MKRKDFLEKSALASLTLTLFSSGKPIDKAKTPTPDETEGPFPTHHPENFLAKNIVVDRPGTPLTINITVLNLNDKCAGLKHAIVDIWHCDSKGEYSEYGGEDEHGHESDNHEDIKFPPPNGIPPNNDSFPQMHGKMPPPGMHFQGKNKMDSLMPIDENMPPPMMGGSMQAVDHKKEHFLRDRQTTNKNGQVSFVSIYPGWYPSRAPHVHVHLYDANGKSLLITQIAFPENISKAVYSQSVYASHGFPETTNADDNVFNDSIANELATLTGNTNDGFVLTHTIYVKA